MADFRFDSIWAPVGCVVLLWRVVIKSDDTVEETVRRHGPGN
jgi:hypothetical protein